MQITDRCGEKFDESAYAQVVKETETEIVITGWGAPLLTKGVMDANPQLKYMCNLTGGVRTMVTREAIENGLRVTNWGNLIGPTVAEAALMAMLSCLRDTTWVAFEMHGDKGWPKHSRPIRSLFYQRVGLHGFGNIAQNLVRLLAPFECQISAFDPYAPDEAFERNGVRRVDDLNVLYAGNRIVSIHAPKIEETYHVVNAEILAAMPDGAILINTARGNIIDTDALVAELRNGRISASLDVYEQEPLPADSPLRGLLNCQLTSHTAGPTKDRYVDFGRAAIENIRRYVNGEAVAHVVDTRLYDLIT